MANERKGRKAKFTTKRLTESRPGKRIKEVGREIKKPEKGSDRGPHKT